jgi:hypothetical protein
VDKFLQYFANKFGVNGQIDFHKLLPEGFNR